MKGILSYKRKELLLLFCVIANNVYAGLPVWTITPLTSTQESVPANVTVSVQYRVTNQSHKPKVLEMKPISGVRQITTGLGVCGSDITLESKGASCILSLQIDGSQLSNSVKGGPILCLKDFNNQCYQPAQANILDLQPRSALSIGDSYRGGIVACMDGGTQNLIAAVNDIASNIAWGGSGTGTNATSFDDGEANTLAIVNAVGDNTGVAYPAKSCADYEVDSMGNAPCQTGNTCYKDWFFPALNQLICLSTNRAAIGNFQNATYWSSTEINNFDAMLYYFQINLQDDRPKTEQYNARCVRQL